VCSLLLGVDLVDSRGADPEIHPQVTALARGCILVRMSVSLLMVVTRSFSPSTWRGSVASHSLVGISHTGGHHDVGRGRYVGGVVECDEAAQLNTTRHTLCGYDPRQSLGSSFELKPPRRLNSVVTASQVTPANSCPVLCGTPTKICPTACRLAAQPNLTVQKGCHFESEQTFHDESGARQHRLLRAQCVWGVLRLLLKKKPTPTPTQSC
jgi:hypothetical protein